MMVLTFLIFPSPARRLAEQVFPIRISKSYRHGIQITSLAYLVVSLGKLPTSLILNFLIHNMEIVTVSNYLKGWLSGLHDIVQIQHFAQWGAYSKYSNYC